MKRMLSNKVVIAIALFTIFTTVFAPAVNANDTSNAGPIELKFLGQAHEQLYFLLDVDNADKKDYTVLILDEAGNTLYRETLKGEKISKKFLINADLVEESQIRFQITSRKSNEMVTYLINQNVRVTSDIVVNKL